MESIKQKNLKEVVGLFLKLGFTTFGGPASFLAITHDEIVKRRKWLNDEKFLDLIGATNLIPGPNAVEMALHLGYLRAGWAGFILSGFFYTMPSVLIVMILAWFYQQYGETPQIAWMLYAVKPVVIAIIAKALWFLGKTALKDPLAGIVALFIFVMYFLGIDTLVLLLAAGVSVMVIRNLKYIKINHLFINGFLPFTFTSITPGIPHSYNLSTLFLTFLKIGSVLYGSGYVLLAFLHSDFVVRLGWLTEKQLIDAVSVGQVTPGPLFTTATFIGFILGGIPGGLIATVGIFLPSIIFVAISSTYIPKIRQSQLFSGFLDGVNAASFALMAAVTVQLARTAIIDPISFRITLSALALFLFSRINTTWVILAALLFGIIRFLIGG